MNKYILLIVIFFFSCVCVINAQVRYLNEVFNAVQVDTGVIYGMNATVQYSAQIGQAIPESLIMDIYRPVGDNEVERPLVLFFHSGNFLPFPLNEQCEGTREDSICKEICTRLAKMGYVVASCDYRLGWKPVIPDELESRESLINAVYRGVQDARTCIRYFKKSYTENANTWGIDTSKIVVWGDGTGGSISTASAFLDHYVKIPLSSNGKFLKLTPNGIVPMVLEAVNGDIYGTSWGIDPAANDTLCYPNHEGYNSNFQLSVNIGGPIMDSSWIDPGQIPLISFHIPTDPYAPYDQGYIYVADNLEVLEVQGSYNIGRLIDHYNNNAIFANASFFDPMHAGQQNSYANSPEPWKTPVAGLYPFIIEGIANKFPWEWTAYNGATGGCNHNAVLARQYIDTIMQFYAPRACFALNLTSCIDALVSTKEVLNENEIGLTQEPNPATDQVRFGTNAQYPFKYVQVYDAIGHLVDAKFNINNNEFTLFREKLSSGMYFIQLQFEKGSITKKVMFR